MNIKQIFTVAPLPLLSDMINGKKGINLNELFLSLTSKGLLISQDRVSNGKSERVWVVTDKNSCNEI